MLGKLMSLQKSGMDCSQLQFCNVVIIKEFRYYSVGVDTQEEFVDYWKVLIYDEDCRDIISPLMNVAALRQKGVTLHLLVSALFCCLLYLSLYTVRRILVAPFR